VRSVVQKDSLGNGEYPENHQGVGMKKNCETKKLRKVKYE
jgi:hypothetical protein